MDWFIESSHRIKDLELQSFWIDVRKFYQSNLSIQNCHTFYNAEKVDIEEIVF